MSDAEWEALNLELLKEKQTLEDRVETLESVLYRLMPLIPELLYAVNSNDSRAEDSVCSKATELAIVMDWQNDINNSKGE